MEAKSKALDAVEASRHWREATSRKLDAMSPEDRIACLRKVRDRYRSTPRPGSARRPTETASS